MKWSKPDSYGAEVAEFCFGDFDIVLQITNQKEEPEHFIKKRTVSGGKWLGVVLQDRGAFGHTGAYPYPDQFDCICLLHVTAKTKKGCKEKLIAKWREFLETGLKTLEEGWVDRPREYADESAGHEETWMTEGEGSY